MVVDNQNPILFWHLVRFSKIWMVFYVVKNKPMPLTIGTLKVLTVKIGTIDRSKTQ